MPWTPAVLTLASTIGVVGQHHRPQGTELPFTQASRLAPFTAACSATWVSPTAPAGLTRLDETGKRAAPGGAGGEPALPEDDPRAREPVHGRRGRPLDFVTVILRLEGRAPRPEDEIAARPESGRVWGLTG